MQWLIIKISSLDATIAEYAFLDKGTEQHQFSRCSLQQLHELANNRRIILLIPSEDVGLHHADIPSVNQKQMTRAIPFALEDAIAEDIEDTHFSFHRASADKNVSIATISKQRLQQWLDKMQDMKVKPHFVLPDIFALPVVADVSTLSIHGERVLYRQDTFSGASFSTDLIPVLLPSLLDHHKGKQEHTLIIDKPDTLELDIPEHIALQSASSLDKICHSSLLSALPLNLLSNFGNSEQTALLEQLSRWKVPAILAALAGGLWVFNTGLQNYHQKQHLNQLNEEIVRIYQDTLPEARVDEDYRINHQVMEEKLKALTGGITDTKSSPLQLLAMITPVLKKHKDVSLDKLNIYNNEVNLSVTASSQSKLEALKTAMRGKGVQAEIKSPTISSNKVVATITIKKR